MNKAENDHYFLGEGLYCEQWIGPSISGNPEVGFIIMRQVCGYPRDTHPQKAEDHELR